MKKHFKLWLVILAAALLALVCGWYLTRHAVPVVQPRGEIGSKERNLIIFCVLISAVIVVPVFGLLGYIAYKYRETNHRAKYTPELGGSKLAETVWWLVPTFIIAVISIVTWQSSYALDPYKPLASTKPTLHVLVVALDWKWLFIYPDQHIAAVNEAVIPTGTPVDFEITSDSVMNSFWVPALGGQMYAMPGMKTQLHLEADKVGIFYGSSANISGKGFADMNFRVASFGDQAYGNWVKAMQRMPQKLDATSYAALKKPSIVKQPNDYRYGSVSPNLYDTIVMNYMMPMDGNSLTNMHGMVM